MTCNEPSPIRDGSATTQPSNVGLRVGCAVVGAAVFTLGLVQLKVVYPQAYLAETQVSWQQSPASQSHWGVL